MTTPSTSKRIATLIGKIFEVQRAYHWKEGYYTTPDEKDNFLHCHTNDEYATSHGDDSDDHDRNTASTTEGQDLDFGEDDGTVSNAGSSVSNNSMWFSKKYADRSGDKPRDRPHDMRGDGSDDGFDDYSSCPDQALEDAFSDCASIDMGNLLGPSLYHSYLRKIKGLYR